jgi:hypothetical protein
MLQRPDVVDILKPIYDPEVWLVQTPTMSDKDIHSKMEQELNLLQQYFSSGLKLTIQFGVNPDF